MIVISDEQSDGLVELLNLAIGRAAASLSKMVNDPILLSVPLLRFVPVAEARQAVREGLGERLCGISQDFDGPFRTVATLIFPREQCPEIVELWVGEPLSREALGELEEETMAEIGNVTLYAALGSIANNVGGKFRATLPEVQMAGPDEILTMQESESEVILLSFIDFRFAQHNVQGYLALLMDTESIERLIGCVDHFINH